MDKITLSELSQMIRQLQEIQDAVSRTKGFQPGAWSESEREFSRAFVTARGAINAMHRHKEI